MGTATWLIWQSPCGALKLAASYLSLIVMCIYGQVMEQHGEEITEEAMQDMPYARACVKEVLRLHPSVNFVFRRALRDFEYEGFLIPKVRIAVHYLHMLRFVLISCIWHRTQLQDCKYSC